MSMYKWFLDGDVPRRTSYRYYIVVYHKELLWEQIISY